MNAKQVADKLLLMAAAKSATTPFGWSHPDCVVLSEAARILRGEPRKAEPKFVDAVLSEAAE